MAASCVISEERLGSVKKIKFDWVSAADGTCSGTTAYSYNGEIIRLITKPALAGLAPDDNYNIRLNDGDSFDALVGAGLLRDTVNTEQVLGSSLGCVVGSKLSLAISAAGADNAGTVIVYIR
jgi:hypothetical protein